MAKIKTKDKGISPKKDSPEAIIVDLIFSKSFLAERIPGNYLDTIIGLKKKREII